MIVLIVTACWSRDMLSISCFQVLLLQFALVMLWHVLCLSLKECLVMALLLHLLQAHLSLLLVLDCYVRFIGSSCDEYVCVLLHLLQPVSEGPLHGGADELLLELNTPQQRVM